jgi:hypothetical protein
VLSSRRDRFVVVFLDVLLVVVSVEGKQCSCSSSQKADSPVEYRRLEDFWYKMTNGNKSHGLAGSNYVGF